MFLQQTKSLCHFYKSTSGLALGGGCTKAFLDSVHGDVSKVCNPDGGPVYQGVCSGTNAVDADGKPLLRIEGVAATILPGLVATVNNTHHEVLAAGENTVELSSEAWLNEMMVYSVNTTGTNSTVTINNPDLYFQGQAVIARYYGGSYLGSFTVVNVDAVNYQITVDDNNALYSAYNEGDIALAPVEWTDVQVTIGGAYSDLQTALNNIDAYYQDQWLFFNEELAPSVASSGSAYWITDGHDGETANNTKFFIVGYNTYAYDCLPDGFGYFPAGTLHAGAHYKTALERAQAPSDAAIKSDLPTASSKNLAMYYGIFRVSANAQNVQFMGIYFENPTARRAIIAENATVGSVFVKHCSCGHMEYDMLPDNYGGVFLWIYNSATGGGMYDNFVKGEELFSGTNPSADASGSWEFAYNVGIRCSNINPEYSGVLVHNNIFVRSHWGVSSVTRGYVSVFNNIFFLCRRAGFNLNSTSGRLQAWNNIVVLDETDPSLTIGLFNIAQGATVDYFDYNCYCNQDGQPVSVFAGSTGGNSLYNLDNLSKGDHDVEADPLFVNPDNFDFNLKSSSPCIGAGRPDIIGNATSIGLSAVPVQTPVGIFGKKIGLYGA